MRTKTVKQSLDPEWSRHFEVPIMDVFQTLKVTVLDEDNGGAANDFLGKFAASVPPPTRIFRCTGLRASIPIHGVAC